MKRVIASAFSVVAMAWVMTGCSGMRVVDSDVTAFSNWRTAPPLPGTTYRFERLPSQQVAGSQQETIEAMARTALAKVGMVHNPATPSYSVQLAVNAQTVDRAAYGGGFGGYGGFGGGFGGFGGSGVFLGGGSRGGSIGLSVPIGISEPYYKRELTLQVRDLGNNQVAYETRAVHDGVWPDTLSVLPAMLDAALLGFPQPPSGTRRINTEIPR
ncbi:MAG: hypothetical protein JWP47_205 [Polaromonas sp.]|jgi:hypothetical protein|nr:hypothetical protein [Polaromonas sp.]